MPGHIGTSIVINSSRYFGRDPKELSEEQVEDARRASLAAGFDVGGATDDDIRQSMIVHGRDVPRRRADDGRPGRDRDPRRCAQQRVAHPGRATTPTCSTEMVRDAAGEAYTAAFRDRLQAQGVFRFSE